MTSAMVPGLRVRVRNSQRDPLRALAPAHNHELAGLPDLRDARGHDVQPGDIGAELDFGNDVRHAGHSIS